MSRHPRPVLAGTTTLAVAALTAALAGPASALPAESSTPAPSASTSEAAGTATATQGAAAQRRWTYFTQTAGAWKVMDKTPYQVTPPEGAVEGWRYATAATAGARLPRTAPSFDDICGKIASEAGKKRVGVVIDYGRPADGPDGANPPAAIARCAVVPTNASASQVLAHAAAVRDDLGMVCGIDNYPSQGCAEAVAAVSETAAAADDKIDISVKAPRDQVAEAAATAEQSSGPSKRVLTAVALVIVAAAGGGAWFWRRRTQSAA
ncbi:MAG: SCO2322 family protein [Dermatophilaceae bacterium]